VTTANVAIGFFWSRVIATISGEFEGRIGLPMRVASCSWVRAEAMAASPGVPERVRGSRWFCVSRYAR